MKLLLLTPCEKVIQDVEQGASLISVFHEIKIQISREQDLPSDAVIPRDWAIFSKFDLISEEEGKEYKSLTRIFWPDGTQFLEYELTAAPKTTIAGMAFTTRLNGFPIGQNGVLRIVQTLISNGVEVHGPNEIEIMVVVERVLPKLFPEVSSAAAQ